VEVEEMKFHLYKHRTGVRVKVPLATPEIIELNEIIPIPFSIQEHYETSSPLLKNNRDDFVHSSSSIIQESITDSSKQTRSKDFKNF
jgi:hypothetical protein